MNQPKPVFEPSTRRRIALFVAVGCAAATVHWSVVVWLVGHRGWTPLVANVAGWLIAFTVSFVGHHRLTFRGHGASAGAAATRFFVVSAGGFTVNEAAYALLLRWGGGHRYDILLAIVLLAVAVLTWLAGRHWAFLRSEAP